ncbi:MAG: hypothetical protein LC667_15275 [Thioalkalivibrio sp.]|nr:hypothetical protein [Thioalkalivibrio sp.]
MTTLYVYPDSEPGQGRRIDDTAEITRILAGAGIGFERWDASRDLPPGADQASSACTSAARCWACMPRRVT